MTTVTRGGVYWAYLDPAMGVEQKGRRPVVVLSNDVVQDNLGRAVVAPLTTQKKDYPTFVPVIIKNKISYIMLDKIRTLDVARLKGQITKLKEDELQKVLSAAREMLT